MAASTLTTAGCGKSSDSEFDSESVINGSCAVQPDQRGTFMAKVSAFPLRIRADASFVGLERVAIELAVAQWNQLGRQLTGQDFFGLEFTRLSAHFFTSDPRDCDSKEWGDAGTFSIVRETSPKRWKGKEKGELGFKDSIPAATFRCFAGKTVSHQAVMTYIKPDSPNDFEVIHFGSVIVHELGHTLGLDHSCRDDAGVAKFRSCNGLQPSHPYHQAVMFPTLRGGHRNRTQPEIKDRLADNDVLRSSCLYGTAR